jgi:hypothetical protein
VAADLLRGATGEGSGNPPGYHDTTQLPRCLGGGHGAPVRGGFYAEEPSLTNLDNGDLKGNVDFRTVYGELLQKVLAASPAQIVGTAPGKDRAAV